MENLHKNILDHLYDGVYFTDTQRRIIYWNKAAERITGYRSEDVVGRSCAANILRHVDCTGNSLCTGACPLSQTMLDGLPRQGEVFLHRKDGSRLPVSVRITPMRDQNQRIVGGIELFSDATEKVGLMRRLRDTEIASLTDPLTGVGNRRHAERTLAETKRRSLDKGLGFGVLMLDLDHFKRVNDDHGHQTGDHLLAAVGATIRQCLRLEDKVSRWGGEEFLILVEDTGFDGLAKLAERLRMLIGATFIHHEGGTISTSVSIGGVFLTDCARLDEAVALADANLYTCKKTGRDKVLVTQMNCETASSS